MDAWVCVCVCVNAPKLLNRLRYCHEIFVGARYRQKFGRLHSDALADSYGGELRTDALFRTILGC